MSLWFLCLTSLGLPFSSHPNSSRSRRSPILIRPNPYWTPTTTHPHPKPAPASHHKPCDVAAPPHCRPQNPSATLLASIPKSPVAITLPRRLAVGGEVRKKNGFPVVEAFRSFTMDLFTPKSDLDLIAMMKDQFANYIVQKRYTYEKHMVARVEKLVATGERCSRVSVIFVRLQWRP
ncbi:hypothetical protein GUJ93_ZPchr0003g16811 [Zizania palustris]|uniref:Uncharacterized protein n=1 Tax=Zizania palustris TaxID=103762 RepID=A0A8J5VX19_ZIZPA|nr:hypothetical protein GUJ93_ZPchr0003g16811 [Zizania palustris]